MLSGGIDSPVAGFLSLKRGIKIDAIYFEVGESAEQDTIFWQKRYFGSIRLKQLSVVSCD